MDSCNSLVDMPELSLSDTSLSAEEKAILAKATREYSGPTNWDRRGERRLRFDSLPAEKPPPSQGQRSSTRVNIPPPSVLRECHYTRQDGRNLDLQGVRSEVPAREAEKRDVIFLVHQFLTQSEAARILIAALPHMKSIEHLFTDRARRSDRALLRAPRLARQLFDRLAHDMEDSDYAGRIPMCFGHGGVWVPCGLNECIKVVRYDPYGHFGLHRDGPWIPREDQGSLFTLVVYLNENFVGGHTEIWSSRGVCSGTRGWMNAMRGDQCRHITPIAGTALVFNHDCWHAGNCVEQGTKYILRTEVIFQRMHSFYLDKYWFRSTQEYATCRRLYEQSQQAIAERRKEDFVTLYQQVVQMQREAMAAETLQISYPPLAVNLDCFACILCFLTDKELMVFVQCSRSTFCSVLSSHVWESKYRAAQLLLRVGEAADPYQLLQRSRRSFLQTSFCFDWSALYIQQLRMLREFIPWVLVISGGSCSLLVATRRTILPYNDSHRYVDAAARWPEPLVVGCNVRFHGYSIPSFFGGWQYSNPLHMNQPMGERWPVAWLSHNIEHATPIVRLEGLVEWEALFAPVDQIVDPVMHPLVLVGHPAWFTNGSCGAGDSATDGKQPDQTSTLRDELTTVFECFRTPAILLVHPASVIAAAYVRQTLSIASSLSDSLSGPLWVLHFFSASMVLPGPPQDAEPRFCVKPPLQFLDDPKIYLSVLNSCTLEVEETHVVGTGFDQAPCLPLPLTRCSANPEGVSGWDAASFSLPRMVLFPEWKLNGEPSGVVSARMVEQYLAEGLGGGNGGGASPPTAVEVSWAAQAEAACTFGLSPTFREHCYFRWS
eukprot:RCo023094